MGKGSNPSGKIGIGAGELCIAPVAAERLMGTWFDRERTARLLVTRTMAIVRCNDAARDLIARHPTLSIARGKLCSRDPEQHDAIAAFIAGSGAKPRNLVVEVNGMPNLLIQPQRIEADGETAYGVTLRPLGPSGDDTSGISEQFGLTPTEDRILRDLAAGMSPRLIAESNSCSHETVRSHIRNIYRKMNVSSRAELLREVSRYKVA